MTSHFKPFRVRPWVALTVLAWASFSGWAAEPFAVRDIRVEGLQRVESGTVFASLPVRVGETYTDEKGAAAIRALFATGFFRDVRIEVQGEVMIVVVEERPAIASIDFVGMKDFKGDEVKKSLRETGIQEGRIFDRSQIDLAEQEIKRQYLSRGKYGVIITTTVTPLDRNRVGVNFTVDEGEVEVAVEVEVGEHGAESRVAAGPGEPGRRRRVARFGTRT